VVVEVRTPGRLTAWRERLTDGTNRRTTLLAVVATVLVAAGLAAVALTPSREGPTRPDVAAATSAAPVETSAATPPSDTSTPASSPQADDWAAVVEDLYRRRAAAFASASVTELDHVYAPGSALLAADQRHVRELAAAGEALRGFAPEVVDVRALSADDDRAELDLVDRWSDYEVVAADDPDGAALRAGAGRAESGVRMVLVRSAEGWRIESASRTG
jgi:hypothetical protein